MLQEETFTFSTTMVECPGWAPTSSTGVSTKVLSDHGSSEVLLSTTIVTHPVTL